MVGSIRCGVLGLCPRCSGRTLFAGMAGFAPHCRACGLDFTSFAIGGRLAALCTLIVAAALATVAIWLDRQFRPSFWLYLVVLPPLTAAAVVGALRVVKGALLAATYRRAAGAGRIRAEDE